MAKLYSCPVPFRLKRLALRIVMISAVTNLLLFPRAYHWYKEYAGNAQKPLSVMLAVYLVPPSSVVLHSCFRSHVWPFWPTILDFFYSVFELLGLLSALILPYHWGYAYRVWSTPDSDTLHTVSSFSLVILYAITCCVDIWEIWCYRGKNLFAPYDFCACSLRNARMDSRATRIVRGIVAILSMLLIISWAFYALVARPAFIMATYHLSYYKTFKRPPRNYTLPQSAVLVLPSVYTELSNVDGVISISILDRPLPLDCRFMKLEGNASAVSCMTQGLHLEEDRNPARALEGTYTVDFSKLPNYPSSAFSSLYLIMPSANATIPEALQATHPVLLLPGVRAFGVLDISELQELSNNAAAVFGLPQHDVFRIAVVRSLLPDPSFPTSQNNQTASLRLALLQPGPDMTVEQEYEMDSIPSGFAFLGGAWTFINGVFAAIFGTTILLLFFGVKPLSVYGLIHTLTRVPNRLHFKEYTLSAEDQQRCVAMLREHLLDTGDADEEPSFRPSIPGEGGRLSTKEVDYDEESLVERGPEKYGF
ncbi:hypothetical protein NP233_g1880 [Leucocoprinus birnbaumii]|uniref:Transmembrane protein n=1 Tax=Leucocoprinus birnbaumii TaxID=56174 RepID=A0AAD5YUG0_9AGAR|nr:hypothetical protein NP233_g1880 [Leucocoprinus birnbaumii]